MIPFFRKRRKPKGQLQTPFGSLAVTKDGIIADLRKAPSQLAELSHAYPWEVVPLGFAVLRLLVYGGGYGALYDADRMLVTVLAGSNNDPQFAAKAVRNANWVAKMIGDDKVSTEEIKKILDWSPAVSEYCSDEKTSRLLREIPSMTDVELATFVTEQLSG